MTTPSGGTAIKPDSESTNDRQILRVAAAVTAIAAVAFTLGKGASWSMALAVVAVAAVDVYLVAVLWTAARRSDNADYILQHENVRKLFPTRAAGLWLVLLLTASLVLAFGRLYQAWPCMFESITPGKALYISFGTLGLNDFGPLTDGARFIAAFEMFSALLLISCVLGLLVSRLSSFVDHDLNRKVAGTPASDVEAALNRILELVEECEQARKEPLDRLRAAAEELKTLLAASTL